MLAAFNNGTLLISVVTVWKALVRTIGVRRFLWLGGKICKFIDYMVKFSELITLSLQISCLKSVGAMAPMGNPPMLSTMYNYYSTIVQWYSHRHVLRGFLKMDNIMCVVCIVSPLHVQQLCCNDTTMWIMVTMDNKLIFY